MNATNRRGFLGSILAACAAPAIIKAEILMPVRTIWKPTSVGLSTAAGMDLANGPDCTSLFRGELGKYNGIQIVAVEAAAMAQAARFFARAWDTALHQAATGKPLLLHPDDDWLRTLKGPAR